MAIKNLDLNYFIVITAATDNCVCNLNEDYVPNYTMVILGFKDVDLPIDITILVEGFSLKQSKMLNRTHD